MPFKIAFRTGDNREEMQLNQAITDVSTRIPSASMHAHRIETLSHVEKQSHWLESGFVIVGEVVGTGLLALPEVRRDRARMFFPVSNHFLLIQVLATLGWVVGICR